jgi:hypothetical protein
MRTRLDGEPLTDRDDGMERKALPLKFFGAAAFSARTRELWGYRPGIKLSIFS